MAAQVRSARPAADIVGWAKFHPLGQRGVNGTGVDGSIPAPEVQTITVTGQAGSSGTFQLTFQGVNGPETTGLLPFNATANQIQTALNALPSIGGALSIRSELQTIDVSGTPYADLERDFARAFARD